MIPSMQKLQYLMQATCCFVSNSQPMSVPLFVAVNSAVVTQAFE
ncbi:hypothetical protein Tsp_09423, partial [Trichinella spiralis]